MAFPFGFTGASAAGACPVPKRRKPPDEAAFRRVASKGVYAGGGSIAEGVPERKLCRIPVVGQFELWEIGDIVALIEAKEAEKPVKRGPYKKQVK